MTRVTFNSLTNILLNDVHKNSKKFNEIQEGLSSGKRINKSSDDPLGTTRALIYRTSLAENEQFAKNVDDGNTMLSLTETSLNDIHNGLRIAKSLLLQGANTPSNDNRSALASQIKELINQSVTTANKDYLGKYIFAGSQTKTKPFAVDNEDSPGKVNYFGDIGSLEVQLSKELSMESNFNGVNAFGVSGQRVISDVKITNKDAALNLALGAAPAGSTFSVTVGSNPAWNIDFLDTAYDSQQDLVDAINAKVYKRGTIAAGTSRNDLLSAIGVNNGTLTINNGTINKTFDVDNTMTIGQFLDLIPQLVPGVNAYYENADNRIVLTNKDSTTLTVADGTGNFAATVGLDVAPSNATPGLVSAAIDSKGRTVIATSVTNPGDDLTLTDGIANGILTSLNIADSNGLIIGNKEDNLSLFDALVKARHSLQDYAYQDNTLLNLLYGGNSLGLQTNDVINLNVGGPNLLTYTVNSDSTMKDLAQNIENTLRANGYNTATVRFNEGILTITNYAHPTVATADIPTINLTATDASGTINRTVFNNAFSSLAVAIPANNSSASSYSLKTKDFIENVQDAITKIDNSAANLEIKITETGARIQHFEAVKNRIADTKIAYNKVLTDIEEADIPELAIKLKQQELILQTSLAAAARSIQPTLADFLR